MASKTASKSGLAVILSRLEAFQRPKVRVEQYTTPSEIAAEVLWSAFMRGDIEGKVIADLGSGTGILGLGAMILGAKRVYFIDMDKNALDIAKNNILYLESEGYLGKDLAEGRDYAFKCIDIEELNSVIDEKKGESVDTVVQNPPFGTRVKHIDKVFLDKALDTAPVVYSFHKSSTERFVKSFCKDRKVSITEVWNFEFPIKKNMEHHTKRVQKIEVSVFRLESFDR